MSSKYKTIKLIGILVMNGAVLLQPKDNRGQGQRTGMSPVLLVSASDFQRLITSPGIFSMIYVLKTSKFLSSAQCPILNTRFNIQLPSQRLT